MTITGRRRWVSLVEEEPDSSLRCWRHKTSRFVCLCRTVAGTFFMRSKNCPCVCLVFA